MDVLTTVLQAVHVQESSYRRIELTAPWGAAINEDYYAVFYVVLQGNCYIEVGETAEYVRLTKGDAILISQGYCHTMRDTPYTKPLALQEVLARYAPDEQQEVLVYGGGGSATTLICVRFNFSERINPLFSALPPFIHIKDAAEKSASWLEPTLQFIAYELASHHPGMPTVISRLADILFIQIIRVYLGSLPNTQGNWLCGLRDPFIAPVLGSIHQHPELPWTVADLAQLVQLSPSAFSARFSAVVGEAPLHYVTRWRMQKAAELLKKDVSIKEVAQLVGYESESSLSKTFKRWMGVWPGAYQRKMTSPLLQPKVLPA